MADAEQLTGISAVVADVMDALGELGVAVLVAVENLFPPIPSEVVLPLAGFLASRGRMDLTLVVVAATIGSVVGAVLLYELGARLGPARLRRIAQRLPLVQAADLDRAEDWFGRHGRKSVLFGRCIPVVRSLVSIPAGVDRMPRLQFVLLTTIGSGVWNTVFVLAGYALGSRFTEVERYSGLLNTAVYAGIALLLGLGVRRRLRERTSP